MGIFQKKPIKATKSLKSLYSQGVFLKRLGHLLIEGFSMKDALIFLSTTGDTKIKRWIVSIQNGLEQGHSFHEELKKLNFNDRICSQIYFSMIHGQFASTIYECGVQQLKRMERKKNLQQILTYPLLLVVFIVGMLFAMRYILLPHITQLTTANSDHMGLGTHLVLVFIRESPLIIIWSSFLIIVGVILFRLYLSEKTAIEISTILTNLRPVKPLLQLYYTQFIALEWGQLIKNGTHLKDLTDIMKADRTTPLIQEIGLSISLNLKQGFSFKEAVGEFSFLKGELIDIIDYGEQSSNLGKELILYSNQCEEELQLYIEKLMTYIQPIVFIGIGIMIVSIYAALLLPTFSLLKGL